MKEQVLEYLRQDYLNNIDLIYALIHGGKIIYFSESGIIIKFNDMYIVSFKDKLLARSQLNKLNGCKMLAVHNDEYQDLITDKFGLKPEITAYQYGYLKDCVKIKDNPKIEIREIGMEYFDFIKANYSTELDDNYLIKRIKANVFIGAFAGEQIVGFAGIHDEGTIGFVEVIKPYRCQGIAQKLETYMIEKLIKMKELIYLQVEIDNNASINLHEKLGYQRGDDIITWYM